MTRSGHGRQSRDLRYDAGLALALTRAGGGGWRELVPQRPRNGAKRPRTAGPVQLDGGPATSTATRSGSAVTAACVSWASSAAAADALARGFDRPPAAALRRRARVRRAPGGRLPAVGVLQPPPAGLGNRGTDGAQLVVPSADRTTLRLARGTLASGEQARLWRVDIGLHARTARRVGVRFTAAGCA